MRRIAAVVCLTLIPALAHAGGWSLSNDDSKLAFGSIKKDKVGEVHHFKNLSGSVDASGAVSVDVDLASVETWIDIRNERMGTHVFAGMGPAKLTAQIDMAAMEAMAVGSLNATDVKGALTLGGVALDIEASVIIARLSESRAMVLTDEMIMVNTIDLGVNAGIDKLMEIAKLPSITRAVPVTMRLVFDKSKEEEAAAPATTTAAAAPAAVAGDPVKGKKVYKKCKSCHEIDKEKNKVGPHLVGILGRPVASVEGFKYSKNMAALGGEWTVERMMEFIKKPRAYVKKTKMSFGGLKKEQDRENLIAYLSQMQ
ncbi:MAG: c-type cytochrome [Pikeienuella sp.]